MMPLFWIALSFVAGILLGKWIQSPLWIWGMLCGSLIIILLVFRKPISRWQLTQKTQKALRVTPAVLLLFLALGGLRYSVSRPAWSEQDLAWYNDRGQFTLVAVVDRSPDIREDATYLHVSARELYDPATMTYSRIKGEALIRTTAGSYRHLGDLLRLTASPQTPSENEDFSYRDYLERQGIYTVIYYPTSVQLIATNEASSFDLALENIRQRASKTIFSIFPQPESGLLAGILLGNDNNLPQSVTQAYRDTGTAHIIAISGFNMAILAGLFIALFSKLFNRYWSWPITAVVLIVYALFVGAAPSVIRAAIMAVITFGGHLIGRKNGGLNALGLTGGLMCLINPLLLWDTSFQLSFMATLGLVLFASPMEKWLENRLEHRFSEETAHRFTGPVSEYFLFTLAAQATTLPVIALQFKRLSLTSLIANPLVLPVQPAILIAGGISTIAGMIFQPLGKILAAVTWPLLAYSNRIVESLAKIRWGSMNITPSTALWISIVLIVAILLLLFRNYFKKIFKNIRWIYWTLFLIVVVGLLWTIVLRSADGNLQLSLVRAEEDSSVFLKSPNGTTLLIDPGGSVNQLAGQVSQWVSPWQFHVDAALITRFDSAKTINDLNDRLPIYQAILAPPVYLVAEDTAPISLSEGIQIKKLKEGESIQIEEGLTIQPVASDLDHTALLLTYGEMRIFIPGGVDPDYLSNLKTTNLTGISILILNETDIANLPPDMWQNLGAQVILWTSPSVSPDPDWAGVDNQAVITIQSDGINYSINQ